MSIESTIPIPTAASVAEGKVMNATLLYRTASGLLLLFAAMHTYGFMKFKPATTEGIALREAMDNVHFSVRGADFTYGGFYLGFGFSVAVYLLFSAYLAWHLGGLANRQPEAIGALRWMFVVLELVCVALAWKYFSAAPAALSALVAACLAWAAWLVQSGAGRS